MQLKAHADRYIRRTPLIRNRLWSAILSKTKKKQKRTNKQTGKEHRIILVYILLLDIVGILLLEIAFYLPLTPTKLPRLETLDLQKTYTGEKHFPFWKYEIYYIICMSWYIVIKINVFFHACGYCTHQWSTMILLLIVQENFIGQLISNNDYLYNFLWSFVTLHRYLKYLMYIVKGYSDA